MKRSVAFVAVLGLFLLGIVIGALGMHLVEAHRPPAPPRPGIHRDGALRGPFWRHLERQLELTPEQSAAIHGILDESRRESSEIRDETRPRVREVMVRAHEEILGLLTPEQRQRLEELQREHPHRLQRWFLGHHGGPDGPPGPPGPPGERGERGERRERPPHAP